MSKSHSRVAQWHLPAGRQGANGFAKLSIQMWHVYALQSLKDSELYIGISQDPEKRLAQHNFGMTSSTKYRKPFILIYKEDCNPRIEAREKEKYFKSGCGREFLKKIKKFIPE